MKKTKKLGQNFDFWGKVNTSWVKIKSKLTLLYII